MFGVDLVQIMIYKGWMPENRYFSCRMIKRTLGAAKIY